MFGMLIWPPRLICKCVFRALALLPQTRLKLHASEEFWWRLYKPGDNIIDQLRSVIGLEYKINKHHTLDFFLRSDNEVQVKNPENVLYVGVAYTFD